MLFTVCFTQWSEVGSMMLHNNKVLGSVLNPVGLLVLSLHVLTMLGCFPWMLRFTPSASLTKPSS